jgi:hypothetical protein
LSDRSHGGGEVDAVLGGGARRGGGGRKGRPWPRCFRTKDEEAPGHQVGRLGQAQCEAMWAGVVVACFAGYASTTGRRLPPRAQARALLSGLGWRSGAG